MRSKASSHVLNPPSPNPPSRDAEWELMGHFSGAYSVAPSCCAALCLCSEGRNYASGLGSAHLVFIELE